VHRHLRRVRSGKDQAWRLYKVWPDRLALHQHRLQAAKARRQGQSPKIHSEAQDF